MIMRMSLVSSITRTFLVPLPIISERFEQNECRLAEKRHLNHGWTPLGGGAAQFLPSSKGGERQDGRDLLLELRRNGFDIVRTRAELEAIPAWRRPKLFGAFSNVEFAFANQVEERSQQPSLSDMVRRAIELLQYNAGGYLLVVDAGLMRKAAQENNGERTLGETAELDRAVAVARRYAGQRSTIIVCGDVAIGGMS